MDATPAPPPEKAGLGGLGGGCDAGVAAGMKTAADVIPDVVADEVADRLAILAGRANAVQAELVDAIAYVIETGAWRGDGYRSVAHWLTIQLGVSQPRARQLEATARRITEFPLLGDQFRSGLLSHDQVHAVVTASPAWADVHAIELIQYATVSQIRRIIRTHFPHGRDTFDPNGRGDHDDAGAEPVPDETSDSDTESGDAGAHSSDPFRSSFSYGWNHEGRFTGSFDLPADLGMVVDAALAEAHDAVFRNREPGSSTARASVANTDALVELAQRSLDGAPSTRRERFKHYVHLDVESVAKSVAGDPASVLSSGTPVPPAIAKYLNCDSVMTPIWEHDSTPIGAGRTTRTISHQLRKLITRRDHGCRVPGCSTTIVEIHHIVHWLNGGVTETWNLVSLCGKHHRMHHQGHLGITGNPDNNTLVFTDRDGTPLRMWPNPIPPDPLAHHPPATSTTTSSPARYRHPTGERLQLRWLGDWLPPNQERWISRPTAAAWHQHQQRTRTIARSDLGATRTGSPR